MTKNFVENKAKIRGNTNKTLYAIALILLLAFGIFAVLPTTNAHIPPLSIPTHAYLNIAPNPVGVGQIVYINMWIDKVPPTSSGKYGDLWHNFTLKITKPDATTETRHFTSDIVGGAVTSYTPTKVGTYTFVFIFPGDTVMGANPGPSGTYLPDYVGDYFKPSTSSTVSLNVTQEPIPSYPSTPLPTGYWQRPIEAVNTDWYILGGNWFGFGAVERNTGAYDSRENFNPYTTAPNTAHVVWTKPLAFGGQIGGEFGGNEESNYYATSHNEPKFAPVIINGVVFYTHYPGSVTYPEGWVAVNLRTGKTLWVQNHTAELRCGQVLNFKTFNQYGGTPYLWGIQGSTYSMYDAMTGNWILNIVKGVSMYISEAADGSLLGYYVNSTSKTLNLWNSTRCITYYDYETGATRWRPPLGANVDFGLGIQWSVKLATNVSGVSFSPILGVTQVSDGVVLMTATPSDGWRWNPGFTIEAGYSANTGQLLWGPINRTQLSWSRLAIGPAKDGFYAEMTLETLQISLYKLATGEQIWGPTEAIDNDPLGSYCSNIVIAYDRLYQLDFGGYIRCFNLTTGTLMWIWHTGSAGYETPYGIFPLWTAYAMLTTVADGKIYISGGHLYSPPMYKGSRLYCVDALNGELIWSVLAFDPTAAPAIADGYIVDFNSYDCQIFCYGKGPSATTISAPDTAVPFGAKVLIQGTVTDQSPGQTCLGIPAAGTPAISDDSMSPWMEYLYQQQPKPTNATGVVVHLTAYDPNGNFQDIGTTTSTADGKYGTTWTPPVPGTYYVTATFEGSNSYYSSEDSTYLAVGSAASPVATATPTLAPTATPTPTATAAPTASPSAVPIPSEFPYAAVYISIAAVIIIIAIAAVAVILRKRK